MLGSGESWRVALVVIFAMLDVSLVEERIAGRVTTYSVRGEAMAGRCEDGRISGIHRGVTWSGGEVELGPFEPLTG